MVGQEIGGAGVGSSCHGARVGKVLLGPSTLAFCRALLYLQELAEELTSVYQPPPCHERVEVPPGSEGGPARKRRGRKPQEHNGENEEDADFVLQEEEEEEESDLMLSETSESELDHLPQGAAVTLPFGIIAGMRWALHGVWGRGGGGLLKAPLLRILFLTLSNCPFPQRAKAQCRGFASNGLHNSIMAPVWKCLAITNSL